MRLGLRHSSCCMEIRVSLRFIGIRKDRNPPSVDNHTSGFTFIGIEVPICQPATAGWVITTQCYGTVD